MIDELVRQFPNLKDMKLSQLESFLKERNLSFRVADSSVFILDKPAGIVVFPEGQTTENTVMDALIAKYPDLKESRRPLRLRRGKRYEVFVYTSTGAKRVDTFAFRVDENGNVRQVPWLII